MRVDDKIDIVSTACSLQRKYMHVMRQNLQKLTQIFFKLGHVPAAPVLDPPLLHVVIYIQESVS